MSVTLTLIVVALAVAIAVVQRRSSAIALLAAQSLTIGAGSLVHVTEGRGAFVSASVVLLAKAIVLPLLLLWLMRRTRETTLVAAARGPLVRGVLAVSLVLLAALAVPPLHATSPHAEHAAVALVLIGVAIVATRRPVLHQLIGLIVAENGIALLAISVPGGLAYVVELGGLLDLLLIVTVAAAFVQRIHTQLGTGNSELLKGLRD